MIETLNAHFVPVAANISHLQRQDDDEGRFLRLVSWQGRFGLTYDRARDRMANTDHRECHQGLFVTTTEGELLGTRHTRDPEQLLEMLGSALKNWERRKTQREAFELDSVERDVRFVWTYPEGGLILQQGYIDLPRRVDTRRQDWRFEAHNQDYVWITRDEMLAIVPEHVAEGEPFPLFEPVARRIVRFHLLDMVRGETHAWAPGALHEVDIRLTPTRVSPDRVDLRLEGRVHLCEQGEWCAAPPRHSPYKRDEMCCMINERGYGAELLGYLAFDRAARKFERFDAVAVGTRWGGTTFNARQDDTDPAPMGIAFTLAGKKHRDRTPPHARPGAYFNA